MVFSLGKRNCRDNWSNKTTWHRRQNQYPESSIPGFSG